MGSTDVMIGMALLAIVISALMAHLRGSRDTTGWVSSTYPAAHMLALTYMTYTVTVIVTQASVVGDDTLPGQGSDWTSVLLMILACLLGVAVVLPTLAPHSTQGIEIMGITRAKAAQMAYVRTCLFAALSAPALAYLVLIHFVGGYSMTHDALLAPLGAAMLIAAWITVRADQQWNSWVTFTPALIFLILIPLISEAWEPTGLRIALVTLSVLMMITIGARMSLQAPLIVGSVAGIAHAIIALRTALPDLVIPWWVWLTIAGVILVALATTYEARIRDARRVAAAVKALR